MSAKNTLFLTSDNEHWYEDSNEMLDESKYAITLEFSKENIRVDCNDDNDLVITVTNPNSELHSILSHLNQFLKRSK